MSCMHPIPMQQQYQRQQQAGGDAGASSVRRPHVGPPAQRSVGPCFACGEMGHLRSYCPKTQMQEKKWYPYTQSQTSVPVLIQDVSTVPMDCAQPSVGGCREVSEDTPEINPENISSREVSEDTPEINPENVGSREVSEDTPEIIPENVSVRWEVEATEWDIMSKHISFWRDEIKAPTAIINVIDTGYVLPLKSKPTPYFHANHHSANRHSSFVQESVSELCATGCVVEVSTRPSICSPLSVVENKTGKKRLVVNLRHLNRFLWMRKFKYEDLRVAMLLLEKGDYLFSFDLKSGYHHVDIAKEHWKYLGFSWKNCYFTFTVLPFGLSSACYISQN